MCSKTTDGARMLLCDGCDAGYHTRCLDPPLAAVPDDAWHCPNCAGNNVGEDSAVVLQRKRARADSGAAQARFFALRRASDRWMTCRLKHVSRESHHY